MKASFLPPVRCQPSLYGAGECSQRRRERTTSAVGVFGHNRGAVNRCSPSRVNSQSGLCSHPDDHLSLALRHSPSPTAIALFQHFLFGARVWRVEQGSSSGKFGVINETCGNNRLRNVAPPKVKAAGRRFLPA